MLRDNCDIASVVCKTLPWNIMFYSGNMCSLNCNQLTFFVKEEYTNELIKRKNPLSTMVRCLSAKSVAIATYKVCQNKLPKLDQASEYTLIKNLLKILPVQVLGWNFV